MKKEFKTEKGAKAWAKRVGGNVKYEWFPRLNYVRRAWVVEWEDNKQAKLDCTKNSIKFINIEPEEFIPLAELAQSYADGLCRIMKDNDVEESVIMQITPTISTIKFTKSSKTYMRIYDGLWKEL